jgi:hypothetical protein
MKILAVGLLALVLAMLAAVAVLGHHGAPRGTLGVAQERAVAGFTQVEIAGIANVTIVHGDSEGVSLEGPKDALAAIKTSVHGATLTVQAGRQAHWWQMFQQGRPPGSAHVTITVRQLERLDASGAVKMTSAGLRGDRLRLDLSGACELRMTGVALSQLSVDATGASKVELSGTARQQEVDLSGAGSYQALDLLSETATLDVSGAGKALVNTSAKLTVDISGAGSVEYVGDPKLVQSVSGVAKIRRRESR